MRNTMTGFELATGKTEHRVWEFACAYLFVDHDLSLSLCNCNLKDVNNWRELHSMKESASTSIGMSERVEMLAIGCCSRNCEMKIVLWILGSYTLGFLVSCGLARRPWNRLLLGPWPFPSVIREDMLLYLPWPQPFLVCHG